MAAHREQCNYRRIVSEIVVFARKAADMAQVWKGEGAVNELANKIRGVPGFGGKWVVLSWPAFMPSLSAHTWCFVLASHDSFE